MIFNSIRWRLQIWYGLILVAVLVGFGVMAHQMERGRQLQRVDDELRRRSNMLANALRPMRDRDRGPDGPRFGGPPPPDREMPPEGPPEGPPNDGPPDPFRRPPRPFHLPPQQSGLFDESDPNGFYFVITSGDGSVVARSTNAPPEVAVPRDDLQAPDAEPSRPPAFNPNVHGPRPARMRGDFREIALFTPPGDVIMVGRSIAPELMELRHTALKLAAFGGIILLLGLAGGWWLAARAIRPIEDISATATKIAAGDLAQRINVADTESELGRLADVLNSTFARLDAAFAQQKQFASDAAHELRTPVSVMLTQTQTALNRERNPAEYRQTLEACQRAAQRMRRLIESLLQLARLDAGQETLKRMRFDLATVAADCVELVRPLAAERGVSLHCDLPSMPCEGDSERVAQVLTNLLTNAIQYNQENGEVRLGGGVQNGTAVLTVADTGDGIAPEDLPRVFARFFRADSSRSSSNAGLGLAISKAIVEAHGGTIEVASESGRGTTFTIRLPSAS